MPASSKPSAWRADRLGSGERLDRVREGHRAASLMAPLRNRRRDKPPPTSSSRRWRRSAIVARATRSKIVKTPALRRSRRALGRAFLDLHNEALYGFATDEPWELVSVRQRASVPRGAEADHGREPRTAEAAGTAAPVTENRRLHWLPPAPMPVATLPRFDRDTVAGRPERASPGRPSSRTPGRPSSSRRGPCIGHPTAAGQLGHRNRGRDHECRRSIPVTLEVIRNALTATAEEMSLVVMRSARSPLLREAGDLSSALTDSRRRADRPGPRHPMHMGVMSFTVKEFLKRVPKERLAPGDVWFLNLPEVGGNHLPDVKAIRPGLCRGRIRPLPSSLAHWADIGGAVPGSYVANATDAWQEGLRIAALPVVHRRRPGSREARPGARQPARCRPSGAAISWPRWRRPGGRGAAPSALRRARRWRPLEAAIVPVPRPRRGADARGARPPAATGPTGARIGSTTTAPVARRCRSGSGSISTGETARFDFSESDDAARGPLNTTPFIAAASVFYAIKALVGPDIQPNGGCYRPLRDDHPAGLGARPRPRATRGRRQPRDLAAGRRRDVQSPRAGRAGTPHGRRADHLGIAAVRRPPRRRPSGPRSTRPTAAARARARIATARRSCGSTCPTS